MGLKSIIPPHAPVEKVFNELVKKSDSMEELLNESKMLVTPDPVTTPSDATPKRSFKDVAREKILTENPRLRKLTYLMELFTEILFYRWSGKKKKHGYIQATINQISVGMQLTEEEANAIMLDDNPV